jgi:hypothetical protein
MHPISRALTAVVVLAAFVVGCGRDERSYEFGQQYMAPSARILWDTVQAVPGHPTVHSVEDACADIVDTTPNALDEYDRDDMVAGCVDELE